MSASQPASVQGLIELARRDGVDIRPTLVRVLVDLHIQEPLHAPVEKARFAELVCRLLDGVDVATRAAVAERLAGYAGTPAVVASRLARDEIRVAEPILRRSTALAEAELHSILDSRGIAHAIAIAGRNELPKSVAERLRVAGTRHPSPLRAPAPSAPRDRALTLALARRYLLTDARERRLILAALPACPAVEPEERIRRSRRNLVANLERAALRHQSQNFGRLLQDAFALPGELTTPLIADPSGEPLLIVCRALDIPFNTTARILLFLSPQTELSADRVFALAESFEQILPAAARGRRRAGGGDHPRTPAGAHGRAKVAPFCPSRMPERRCARMSPVPGAKCDRRCRVSAAR
jgi:uncharacterized protein (DUF2336 family)